MGKGGIEIPDWRIYKVENVPELKAVQERLALRGLKDPWLRNEVWRYQPCFKRLSFWQVLFRGFPIGAGLFVVAVGLEKMFSSKDDHGHH
ncbi:NADH dehydrogenase [ubiquinone] 1 beta subcomplex subunit 3-like [Diadema setosum]|uniref:NADH dehydrogenase [ubiquinone] 1 beta subcomplex subunit 3-like n=1 Tax=Diadema antillarum TaxID=105358 RepID=UPI003A838CC4